MKHLFTSGDSHLFLWIIIAVVAGAMAGLITAIFSRHGKDETKAHRQPMAMPTTSRKLKPPTVAPSYSPLSFSQCSPSSFAGWQQP